MNRKTATRFKRITAVLSSIFLASAAFAGTGLIADASATSITRISGSTRYETMAMVSQTAFPSAASRAAVIASGSSFPDALAASSLAGHLNAPILLTDPKTLSNATVDELNRLDVDTIYIIGGSNAVSNNVEKAIQASRPSATIARLAGSTRFDTAYQIYSELTKLGVNSKTAIISTGANFADALSASPYSYMQSAPFFLSSQSGLDEESLAALKDFQSAIIVGGTNAVPLSVEQQLRSIGVATSRLQGTTRYETSLEIGKFTLNNLSLDPSSVVYATGANFPDALFQEAPLLALIRQCYCLHKMNPPQQSTHRPCCRMLNPCMYSAGRMPLAQQRSMQFPAALV